MGQVKRRGGKNPGDLDPAFEALQRGRCLRRPGREMGDWATLPCPQSFLQNLLPACLTTPARKESSEQVPGPGDPFDLEETHRWLPRGPVPPSTRGTPSHVRSGAQKLAVGVCLSRPRTCSVQGEPARARPPRAPPRAPLLQPLRCRRELGATASDCGGVKPRRRSRVSVAGPGKPGAPRGPRESTFESTRNEDGRVSFVGTANAVMYACTRMAEWLRRWT